MVQKNRLPVKMDQHPQSLLSVAKLALLFWIIALLSACANEHGKTDFSIEKYAGKWFVLNYWATWCGPCADEIPELNELSEQHGDRIVVAGVNYDKKSGEELEKDVEKMGIRFETLVKDPANVLKLSRPEGLPVTYLFNPDGELGAKLVGPQTMQELLDRIELLESKAKMR